MFPFRSVFTPPTPVVNLFYVNAYTEMLKPKCMAVFIFYDFLEEKIISLSAQYVIDIIFISLAKNTLFSNAVSYFLFSVNVQASESLAA